MMIFLFEFWEACSDTVCWNIESLHSVPNSKQEFKKIIDRFVAMIDGPGWLLKWWHLFLQPSRYFFMHPLYFSFHFFLSCSFIPSISSTFPFRNTINVLLTYHWILTYDSVWYLRAKQNYVKLFVNVRHKQFLELVSNHGISANDIRIIHNL